MAPKRDPRREQAYEIYKQHGGQIQNRQIANMLDLPERTVGGWKSKDHWDDKLGAETNGVLQSTERSTPIEKGGTSPPVRKKDTEKGGTENAELTRQQSLFVEEYLKDLNATQAAIRAGYSPKTAREQGHRLFTNVHIRSAIDKAMEARVDRVQVDADWVLKRLVRLADYNLHDFANLQTVKRIFVTKGGEPLEDEVQTVVLNPDFDGSIAKALNQDKDGIKLEMPDRLKALELIGKHIGMFSDPQRVQADKERMQLERERFEHQKAMDEAKLDLATYKALPPQDEDAEPTEPDGYNEAMGGMNAQEVWSDDDPATES